MNEIYRLESIKKYYNAKKAGFLDNLRKIPRTYVRALDDVSMIINRDSIIAVVGESGSGKTTLGKIIATIEDQTSGERFFYGRKIDKSNIVQVRRKLDIVFQNPKTSLNPRVKIVDLIAESLGKKDESKVESALERVGLSFREIKDKQPRELSGGQIQRVAIAKALVKTPELIILDEPTSALDESVQSQVLNILEDLRGEYKTSYLFITHNILIAGYMSNIIIVLYAGKIMEQGDANEVLRKPMHPYTQLLLSSIPKTTSKEVVPPIGDVPDLINIPTGCRFHPRCPYVMEKCKTNEPPLNTYGNYSVACWLYE